MLERKVVSIRLEDYERLRKMKFEKRLNIIDIITELLDKEESAKNS